MEEPVAVEKIAQNLGDPSARGIAMHVRALIRAGVIPHGARLPPVRDIAFVLGISPATVSAAWSDLRKRSVLEGRGRNGIRVADRPVVTQPTRFASAGRYGSGVLDLSFAVPDTALLPPLEAALAYGARAQGLNSYSRVQVQPELEEVLRNQWPYQPEAMLAVNGGYSAVHMVLGALSLSDAVVAVEDPTPMRHLDILEHLGAIIVPVANDGQGPRPDMLARVMEKRPAAFLFQPRLNSVTGYELTPQRLRQLGDVLANADTAIIEDDGLGGLSTNPPQSLGSRFPDRTTHILSFSKPYGPDLRLAVLSANADLVARLRAYRSFNSGGPSRILQSATAWLLRDSQTAEVIAHAKQTYAERNRTLSHALQTRGITHRLGAGLATWMRVSEESFAMITLAAHGIAVMPGSRMSLRNEPHIRVATGIISKDYDRIADALALACGPAG
uniref:aminotransferase-like domain-containing protein n=1 Tax=Paracoccus sp. TRP TaxID=412597 RepID=UPI000225F62D|nr:aminotransferase class I/II-fold pyridoxal phosphate-dependent enzyme [Paracoccus sp. TRP]